MNPCLSIRVALAVILLGGLNPAAAADPGARVTAPPWPGISKLSGLIGRPARSSIRGTDGGTTRRRW